MNKRQQQPPTAVQVIEAFKAAMLRSMGVAPDTIDLNDHTRFDDPEGKRGNKACYCRLYLDQYPAGYFGNWRTDLNLVWSYRSRSSMTHAERQHFNQKLAEAKKQHQQETLQRQQEAQKQAFRLLSIARPANPRHPYLISKQVGQHDLLQLYDTLLVPLFSEGQLINLQRIYLDKSEQMQKRFLSGGRTAGAFAPIGLRGVPAEVNICEGWATGASIHEATGQPVLCAMNASNLKAVALFTRKQWPTSAINIYADDDRPLEAQGKKNQGQIKAREAAIAVNAQLFTPDWPADAPEHLTDFNDLANWIKAGSRYAS